MPEWVQCRPADDFNTISVYLDTLLEGGEGVAFGTTNDVATLKGKRKGKIALLLQKAEETEGSQRIAVRALSRNGTTRIVQAYIVQCGTIKVSPAATTTLVHIGDEVESTFVFRLEADKSIISSELWNHLFGMLEKGTTLATSARFLTWIRENVDGEAYDISPLRGNKMGTFYTATFRSSEGVKDRCLKASGFMGIFLALQERTYSYKHVWLPADASIFTGATSMAQRLRSLRANLDQVPRHLGVVRNATNGSLGIRCKESDLAVIHEQVKPGIDLRIGDRYNLHGVPDEIEPTQLLQVLAKTLQWEATILRKGRGDKPTVVLAITPPTNSQCSIAFRQEVWPVYIELDPASRKPNSNRTGMPISSSFAAASVGFRKANGQKRQQESSDDDMSPADSPPGTPRQARTPPSAKRQRTETGSEQIRAENSALQLELEAVRHQLRLLTMQPTGQQGTGGPRTTQTQEQHGPRDIGAEQSHPFIRAYDDDMEDDESREQLSAEPRRHSQHFAGGCGIDEEHHTDIGTTGVPVKLQTEDYISAGGFDALEVITGRTRRRRSIGAALACGSPLESLPSSQELAERPDTHHTGNRQDPMDITAICSHPEVWDRIKQFLGMASPSLITKQTWWTSLCEHTLQQELKRGNSVQTIQLYQALISLSWDIGYFSEQNCHIQTLLRKLTQRPQPTRRETMLQLIDTTLKDIERCHSVDEIQYIQDLAEKELHWEHQYEPVPACQLFIMQIAPYTTAAHWRATNTQHWQSCNLDQHWMDVLSQARAWGLFCAPPNPDYNDKKAGQRRHLATTAARVEEAHQNLGGGTSATAELTCNSTDTGTTTLTNKLPWRHPATTTNFFHFRVLAIEDGGTYTTIHATSVSGPRCNFIIYDLTRIIQCSQGNIGLAVNLTRYFQPASVPYFLFQGTEAQHIIWITEGRAAGTLRRHNTTYPWTSDSNFRRIEMRECDQDWSAGDSYFVGDHAEGEAIRITIGSSTLNESRILQLAHTVGAYLRTEIGGQARAGTILLGPGISLEDKSLKPGSYHVYEDRRDFYTTTISTARPPAIELYAGIAATSASLQYYGLHLTYAIEECHHAAAVIQTNYPGTTVICSDVLAVDFSLLPRHAIIIAGLPCQPYSYIGAGKGLSDVRGGRNLVAFLRIIRAIEPLFIILEEVEGFKNTAFEILRMELERIGYNVSWGVKDLGTATPQQRKRFIVTAAHSAFDTRIEVTGLCRLGTSRPTLRSILDLRPHPDLEITPDVQQRYHSSLTTPWPGYRIRTGRARPGSAQAASIPSSRGRRTPVTCSPSPSRT